MGAWVVGAWVVGMRVAGIDADRSPAPPAGPESLIERRCFVVGCPRSGTTLVQAMLAAHSDVMSFPETKYVSEVVGDYPRRALGRPASAGVRGLRTRLRVGLGLASRTAVPSFRRVMRELDRPELTSTLHGRPLTIARAVRALVENLDRIAEGAGRGVWVEKTPTYYAYLEYLERHCDAARFVHVIRPGADVIASLTDAARRHPNSFWARDFGRVEDCVRVWNRAIEASASRVGRPEHYLLDFARLTADPATVLRDLCRWLDIEFEPGMATDYGRAAERLLLPGEHWKAGVREPVRTEDKFRRLFSEDEQARILEQLAPLAAVLPDSGPATAAEGPRGRRHAGSS
mgnify:FL=1